jgi:prophage antirepressor-like protein
LPQILHDFVISIKEESVYKLIFILGGFMQQVQFQDLSVSVYPTNDSRQWYMTVEQTAEAYGVSRTAIMNHLVRHADELRQGVEAGVTNSDIRSDNGVVQQREQVILYREGVIKLGFFIRSPKAAAFRQFATNLIMHTLDSTGTDIRQVLDHLKKHDEAFERIDNICRGFRDEIDELQTIVGLLFDEADCKLLQAEIKYTKQKMNCDGRKLVGLIRQNFNTNSVYGNSREMTIRIVRYLKQVRGDLTVIEGSL